MRHLATAIALTRGCIRFRRHSAGRRVKIGFGVIVKPAKGSRIYLGNRVDLKGRIRILFRREDTDPTLTIGDRTYIQPGGVIHVAKDISIGADCAISWNVEIFSTDYHAIVQADGTQNAVSAPVTIGNKVLIGSGVKILKGTQIGDGCVIGAGSVVSGKFPPNSIIVGSPARAIKSIVSWSL